VSITENEGSADVQSGYMWSSYQHLAWTVTVMLPSLVNLQLVKDISYCLEYSCKCLLPTVTKQPPLTTCYLYERRNYYKKPCIAYHITGIIMTAFIVLWQETVFYGLNPKVIQSMFYLLQSASCDMHLTPHSQLVQLRLTYHIPLQLSAIHWHIDSNVNA